MGKIIFLLCTNRYAGAENMVMLTMRLLGKRHEVWYSSPTGEIEKELRERGLPYIPIERLSIKEIHRLWREYRPDLFHATDYRVSVMCALANVKFVSHVHNNSSWIKRPGIQSLAYLYAGLRAERIIAVSKAVRDEYVFSPLLRHKVRILPNVVDGELILEKAGKERIAGRYDILFSGRFTFQKNPLFFVEIVSELKRKRGRVKAVMLGQGELRAEIQKEIRAKRLEKDIELPGHLENPFPVMAAADVLVMPSCYEGFGLAAVEAMLLGKPVVCCPAGGLVDLVDDTCGKICGGKDEFVTELGRLLEDEAYYRQKSLGAAERAKRFTDLQGYGAAMEEIWQG